MLLCTVSLFSTFCASIYTQGQYGLKRFFRDGYKTVVEDPNRTTYYSSELKVLFGD